MSEITLRNIMCHVLPAAPLNSNEVIFSCVSLFFLLKHSGHFGSKHKHKTFGSSKIMWAGDVTED